MANTNKRGVIYYLEKIWEVLSSVPFQRYEVTDITSIDGTVLDALKCGDQVAKVTGVMKHLYTVSYKGEGAGQGICLTYVAAGLVETVSYDRTESGWAYNSTDKSTLSVD